MTIILAVKQLLAYQFMQHAFIAGTIAAFTCAIIGFFVVLRGQNFASHALSHISFAGAAGAGLIGLSPPAGQLILTVLAGITMGSLGERISKSDIAIGMVLSFSLGLGVLFLFFYTNYAGHAMSILFGDLLGVSAHLLWNMFIYSLVCLAGLLLLVKPLLFATLEPELAEAKGISLRFISIGFLALVAIAVTEASQIVGVLLVFTLLIGPAASALSITRSLLSGVILSILIGLTIVWIGIILTYLTDWPASFWISTLSFLVYLLTQLIRIIYDRRT